VNGIILFPAEATSPSDLGRYGIAAIEDAHAGATIARQKILRGRRPDPRRVDEVLINRVLAAKEHLDVGSTVHAVALQNRDLALQPAGDADIAALLTAVHAGTEGQRVTLHVVGVGVTPDEIVVDQGFETPAMMLTPAFGKRYPDTAVQYWGEYVRLRHGAADVAGFRKAVSALVPDEAIAFQTASVNASKVERAVEPSVGALGVFAIVIVLTGLLVIGQALARQSFLDSVDYPVLHALGLDRRQRFASAMLRALVVAVLGSLLAVALAIAISPLTPIGPARTAEPDPGLGVDTLVVFGGAVVLAGAVLLLATIPSWRYARTRAVPARAEEASRPSRIATSLAAAGSSLPMLAGVRMALEPGRGRTAVPVRTTILSAMLALATITAAIVFAASLNHLVDTPRLYGWNWDIRVDAGADTPAQDATATAQLTSLMRSSPAVEGFSVMTLSDVVLDGRSTPALGVETGKGTVGPSIVSGRIPRRNDEIALGSRTLDELGLGIGDVVRARLQSGSTMPLRVVGRVVLPGFGTYSGSDKTTLGEGAVLTQTALSHLGPNFNRHPFLVDLRPGANTKPLYADARKIIDAANSAPSGLEISSLQRPSDIIAYDRVRSTPVVLAAVLVVLALATVGHALVAATRRRRRDLALLKTLGFTRHQVSAAVAWQATTIGVLALIVGLPVGVVLGRWSWRILSDSLGTVAEPVVPVVALLIAIPAVILLVNVIAFVPGRLAARLRPAIVLRSE
jgi:ABC-type lipoprotein release transport system permease subunit